MDIETYNEEGIDGVYALVLGAGKKLEQQCAGYACLHKVGHGRLIKIGGNDQDDALCNFFTGEKWGGWCDSGIDEETAKFIEKIVPRFAVDRSRFDESCEAWIHGFLDGRNAILVWANSD